MKMSFENTRKALGIATDLRDRAAQATPVGAEAGKDILLGTVNGIPGFGPGKLSARIGRETL